MANVIQRSPRLALLESCCSTFEKFDEKVGMNAPKTNALKTDRISKVCLWLGYSGLCSAALLIVGILNYGWARARQL
jgi:hypothetical protein